MSRRRAGLATAALVAVLGVFAWLARDAGEEAATPSPVPTVGATGTLPADGERPPATSTLAFDATPAPLPPTGSPEVLPDLVATGVVMAAGEPFEGARVDAVVVESHRYRVRPVSAESAASGPDGRFELRGLPRPPFRLRAQAPGWRPGWAEVGSLGDASRLDGFVLVMGVAGSITGRVTAGGAPVAGAEVFAGDEGSNDLGASIEAEATTAPDGTFRLDPVRPGRMTVAAFAPHAGFANAVVDVAEGGAARVDLALEPLGVVRGLVLDESGRPIEGATVTAVDPGDLDRVPPLDGASRRLLTVSGRMQVTHTDRDGRFELRSLLSSKPRLAVRAHGFTRGGAAVEIGPGGEAPPVEIRLAETQGL